MKYFIKISILLVMYSVYSSYSLFAGEPLMSIEKFSDNITILNEMKNLIPKCLAVNPSCAAPKIKPYNHKLVSVFCNDSVICYVNKKNYGVVTLDGKLLPMTEDYAVAMAKIINHEVHFWSENDSLIVSKLNPGIWVVSNKFMPPKSKCDLPALIFNTEDYSVELSFGK